MGEPTYTPVGDGYLWICDLCGCAVASSAKWKHDLWHEALTSVTSPGQGGSNG